MGFQSNRNNGFHMTFANGWTVSVQYGAPHYCTFGETADVAVWDKNGDLLQWSSGDTFCGDMTADSVAELLSRIASIHPAKTAALFEYINCNTLTLKPERLT